MTSRKSAREFGQRLKAALVYKGWTVQTLADRFTPEERKRYRLSKTTLDRLAQGKRELQGDWELDIIVRKLEVPEWFLRGGFSAAEAPPASHPESLEGAIDELAELVRLGFARVQEQLDERAVSPVQNPPDLLASKDDRRDRVD